MWIYRGLSAWFDEHLASQSESKRGFFVVVAVVVFGRFAFFFDNFVAVVGRIVFRPAGCFVYIGFRCGRKITDYELF